jgi:AraC-like DNA-binding protein
VLANGSFYQNGDVFYNHTSFFSSHAKYYADWVETIRKKDEPYSFTTSQVTTQMNMRDATLFTVSLPLNTNLNRTFFFTVLDHDAIKAMLVLPDILPHTVLTVTDSSGQLLLSHDPGNIENYTTIRQTSPVYGLTAEINISQSISSKNLSHYKNIALVILAIFILIGFALSFLYSWSNARPLVRMITAANNTCSEIGGSLSGLRQDAYTNGYQYLNAFISQVDLKLKTDEHLLVEQEKQLRQNFFERLIHGEIYSDRSYELAKQYFPGFPEQYRMVLAKPFSLLALQPKEYAAKQIKLRSILELLLPKSSYFHFSSNFIVIILPRGYLDDRNDCERLMIDISNRIISDVDIDVRIAVGFPSSGLSKLSQSFLPLQNFLRLSGNKWSAKPLFLEDQKAIRLLPSQGIQHASYVYEHLIRAQSDMALMLLDEDLDLLRKSGYVSEADVQQLFFSYRQVISMAVTMLDEEEEAAIILPSYHAKNTIEETFSEIKQCINQIGYVFEQKNRFNTESFERTLLDMIDNNLSNPDLYIRVVTERFSISESTLQRTMHKATGKSFFEYVDMKRMNLARHLVMTTDKHVKEIMTLCGYNSMNSFYKAFKRRYGQSPTAMRERKKQSRSNSPD